MRQAGGWLHLRAPAGAAERATSRAAPRASVRSIAPGERPVPVAEAVKIVGWLSLSAGAIHAIAMVDHFSHWWLYGVVFGALTYGQALWGIALLRMRATDRSLLIGARANLAIVALWALSRTLGVPFGPEAGDPERIGVMDVAATLDQLVLATYVALVLRPRLRAVCGLGALLGPHRARIGMMLCSASVFAALLSGGHTH